MSYQYNSLNQRSQMVTPDGRTINYTYDNGNRLWQVLSSGLVAEIIYDLAGRRQTLSYPNLVATTYTPNRAGFLANLLTRYNQQTTINSFAYTPDGMGNRANMTDLAGQHVYTPYDDTYQLTNATHPNMPLEQFTYDPVGNRLSSEGQTPSAGRSTVYVYDFENRLVEVDYAGMLAQYKYDPFGRRIEKNVNGTTTRYLYDGPNIATEYDGSWNPTSKYIHTLDIDDPLTVTQGANTYYYHKDGLGSVVNLTDASGSVVKSYTYKSFGEIYSQTGSIVQPFTFTGREYDSESGLYFYRARYYDPKAGRFLTKDPIGFAGGDVNLYRYVFNNPVNYRDPSGLLTGLDHFGVALIAGIAEAIPLGKTLSLAWEAGVADVGTQKDLILHAMAPLDPSTGLPLSRDKFLQAFRARLEEESKCGPTGKGLHMITDFVTPEHGPGFPWPSNNPFKNPDVLPHYLGEMFPYITTILNAIGDSRAYLRSQGRR